MAAYDCYCYCCEFGDLLCWFSHVDNISSLAFKCNMCDNTFSIQPDYLRHRKTAHSTIVPNCRNNIKGECKYGDTYCWFKHEKNESETDEKSDIMQKLFHVMEKMTERISELEKLNPNISEK